ncbi:hypothetical protein [Hyalangium rubrum]|uniref:DUF4274 domain-containing protein n=1 Tax=Hyalangium rubrum TaxID=3103134 RepID=A0ABU5H2I3_9BACT|nr:hypothetical protein [Hyalangium sp. s54d21]MDY7227317.1 hypothetical protein [Hyalangium sp. s54d21]
MTTAPTDPDHLSLREAIRQALGQDTPDEVLGGAVEAHTGRVAWIQQRISEPQGQYMPVDIDLHVAGGGLAHTSMAVPTYNPYFGCKVEFARWWDEALIILYSEKHLTLVARMDPPYEALELVQLHWPWAVVGDTVYFVSRRPGLLEGRLLPSLAPALPLPMPRASNLRALEPRDSGMLALVEHPPYVPAEDAAAFRARAEAARTAARLLPLPPPEARALVLEAPENAWARLEALLEPTVPPPFGVDILVGSLASHFWRDPASRGRSYNAVAKRVWNTPEYLAVYWYLYLVAERRAEEAHAWLGWLDQLAAPEDGEQEPWLRDLTGAELVARTALAYIRLRAATLAEACRTGKLPEGESCFLFNSPDRIEPFMRDTHFPQGFREALWRVAARKPKSLSER